jgi:tRNA nucleotidyltransferase (CCA-adding enzyme)
MLRLFCISLHSKAYPVLSAATLMTRKLDIVQSGSHSRSMATLTISLTERERRLKSLLLGVAKTIDQYEQTSEPLTLRWAGGWVRDKILGTDSHDIDTAISAMTGYSFGLELQKFCNLPENVKKYGIEQADLGNVHKITANPDKSKHLETATTKLFGLDVDFVHLRKEKYSEDSRNPQAEFGTAQEDSLRRDATINALFYNLHTDEVEDFTGGLVDMEACLIRTPLDPYQTFMDDPLRILRLVRFASRLEFKIEPATQNIMSDCSVLKAFQRKISRERVGVELEKMLKGK